MDAIIWLIIGLVSVWLAYSVVAVERRRHGWGGVTAVGVYIAVFGAAAAGLDWVYGLMRPKLVDDLPSENALLFVGLVVLAGLIVLALDLFGTIDIMSQVQKSMHSGRPNPGGPSGDD